MATISAVRRRQPQSLDRSRGGSGLGSRLRRRFIEAGPLAARFGIYLGSRIELLSGADCLELLEIPDRAAAGPPGGVTNLIDRELGGRPAEIFTSFEAQPFDSSLVHQWHRAELPDGQAVTVQLIHPELEAQLEGHRLHRLIDRAVSTGELPDEARAVLGEFESGLDLAAEVEVLERFSEEAEGSDWVVVPQVHRDLCSKLVRVRSSIPAPPAEIRTDEANGQDAHEARARRLCRVWIAMALGGGLFPLEPWGGGVRYLQRGRVAFLGGNLHRLQQALPAELREYLAAVAAPDPDRAARALVELFLGGASNRQLIHRIRHAAPFRDRGWDIGGDDFVRQVLAQWQAAVELGRRPRHDAAPFYRGLFLLNHEVQRLAGNAPSVRDGFREARLLLLFGEWRDEGRKGRLSSVLESQANLLIRLPQKLDRVLSLAEREAPRGEGGGHNVEPAPRPRGAWAAVAACLIALSSVVLLTHYLGNAGVLGAWGQKAGALLVLLLGGLSLRVAVRADDGRHSA